MYSHGIDVFDEADCYFLAFGITDDFQLQFFPSKDRLFDENLSYKTRRKSPGGNSPQFVNVINQPSARASHCVGRPNDDGVAELLSDNFGLFYVVSRFAQGHFDTQLIHRVLERNSVFAAFNRVNLYTYDLNTVFIQYTGFV